MISHWLHRGDLDPAPTPRPLLAASGGGGGSSAAGGIRAGAAFVELFAKDNALLRAFDRARDRTRQLAGYMAAGGATAAAASATILGAVGSLFAGVVKGNVEAGRMARRFGDTVENFTALQYAAAKTGVPIEQLGDVLENLPERIDDAVQGGGEAAEVFRRMGIDARGFMALPLTERFARLADGLQGFNDVQRSSILGKLFSDKGQMLGEMFAGGSAGFKGLLAEAGALGAVVSTEQERQSKEVSDAWFMAAVAAKTAVAEIGAALLPQAGVIRQVAQGVVAGASAIRQWISANKEAIQSAVLAVAGVGALAAAIAAAGVTISAVLSPVGLWTTAITGLGYLFVTQTQAGGLFAEKVKTYFRETADTATKAWAGISAALRAGDLELAGKIVLAALQLEWDRFKDTVIQGWEDVKDFFIEGLAEMEMEFRQNNSALIETAVEAWDLIRQAAEKAWEAIEGVTVVGFLRQNQLFEEAGAVAVRVFGDMRDVGGAVFETLLQQAQSFADHLTKLFDAIDVAYWVVFGDLAKDVRKNLDDVLGPLLKAIDIANGLKGGEGGIGDAFARLFAPEVGIRAVGADGRPVQDNNAALAGLEKENRQRIRQMRADQLNIDAQARRAELAALVNRGLAAGEMAPEKPPDPKIDKALRSVASAVAGAFGGAGNLQGIFGRGGNNLQERQLKEQEMIRKNTEDAAKAIQDLKGMAFI